MRRYPALLAVGLALVLLGAAKKLPPLAEQVVVVFATEGCVEGASWVPEVDYGVGQGWTPIAWNRSPKAPSPGDGCAFALLLTPKFRACCVYGEERRCDEAVEGASPFRVDRIFDLQTGRAYSAEDVGAWNAAHQ